MNRRAVVALVAAAVVTVTTTGASGGCGDGNTGAGQAQKQDPIGKALPHNHEVYIEVQWEPDNRPVEISWTIGGQFHGYRTFTHSPFTVTKLQGDEEIAVHARQKEQGYLRAAIEVDGAEPTGREHDATNEYHGSVDVNYKPTHAGGRA